MKPIKERFLNKVYGAYDYGFRYRQMHTLVPLTKMPKNIIYAGWAIYIKHSEML